MSRFYRDILIMTAAGAAMCLGGCGTVSPTVHEAWGTPADTAYIKQELMGQASCELSRVVRERYQANPRLYGFLRGWVATIELLTDIDEKNSFAPAISLIDPLPNAISIFSAGRTVSTAQSFTLGLGTTISSEARALDKMFLTFKLDDMISSKKPDRTCLPNQNHASLFPRVPLEIETWLRSQVSASEYVGRDSEVQALGQFPRAGGGIPAVLSRDVTFEIVTSGSITPTWKLVRIGTGTNPLGMSSRDRKQEIIITMSPADPRNPNQLGPLGIGAAISADTAATIRRVGP